MRLGPPPRMSTCGRKGWREALYFLPIFGMGVANCYPRGAAGAVGAGRGTGALFSSLSSCYVLMHASLASLFFLYTLRESGPHTALEGFACGGGLLAERRGHGVGLPHKKTARIGVSRPTRRRTLPLVCSAQGKLGEEHSTASRGQQPSGCTSWEGCRVFCRYCGGSELCCVLVSGICTAGKAAAPSCWRSCRTRTRRRSSCTCRGCLRARTRTHVHSAQQTDAVINSIYFGRACGSALNSAHLAKRCAYTDPQ